MHDRIIEIKHDASKLVLRLKKKHHKNVGFPLSYHPLSVGKLVHFYKEPHPENVDYDVHLLSKVPRNIPPGQQINKCVNIDGSTRIRNRSDITE